MVTTPGQNKAIRLDRAIALAHGEAKSHGLSMGESKLLELLTTSCTPFTIEGVDYVRINDLQSFARNFQKAIETSDFSWMLEKRGLMVDRVVDVEEFLESKEYWGQKGYVRPRIKKELIRLFYEGDYVEAVLTGAIGIGKNYMADAAVGYMLYLLSCYHNPQLEFDLAPGSSIVFIMQSKTERLARKVVFEQFAERVKLSPYFKQNFSFDPYVKSELRFPKNINIMPVGGDDTSALGFNVYGGVLDELNFMDRVKNSAHTQHTGEEEYDQAERLYSTITRRMKSRFMQKGKLPGKLLLISSRNYPGDFTDRKMEEARDDKTIFVMSLAQWESLPAENFSGEKFLVEVGSDDKQSRIIASMNQARDEGDVIEVPIEYKSDFDRDIEAALKDLAGVATSTRSPFIPYRELIASACSRHEDVTGGMQLFTQNTLDMDKITSHEGLVLDYDPSVLINEDYLEQVLLDNRMPFAAHVDVGLNNDAAGIAVGHIAGYLRLPSVSVFHEKKSEFVELNDIRAPIYMIDGVLQVVGKQGKEVDLDLVRDLILLIRSKIYLKWTTADSWQSAQLVKSFRKARIRSGWLSVDSSLAPYAELKLSIKDERLMIPDHPVATREIREVEKDRKKDKVDHPAGGSKDCSDAIAGVCYMLQTKEANYGQAVAGRRKSKRSDPIETEAGEAQSVEDSVRKIRTRKRWSVV